METRFDWQPVMNSFFRDTASRMAVVELGKGEGTRFLVDNFNTVTSIEYSRYPFTASWEKDGLPNHVLLDVKPIPNLIELDNVLVSSNGLVRPPELNLEAIRLHTEALNHVSDVLFIDHGCHNRGEVLEHARASNLWAFIVVHDSNYAYYRYDLGSCRNYRSFECNDGQGTCIFVRK